MEWLPHVTVATVVERDGQYLLVEEICSGKQVINQPAGHLDPDETLIEAAIRETAEETGWKVEITSVLGVALYTSPSNDVTYHRTTFIAKAIAPIENAELDEGIIGPVWMTKSEVKNAFEQGRLRSPLVLETIEQYEKDQSYSLDMFYGD